eukprot:7844109-Lingulodinium_polyedra.AAC.1
MSPKSAADTGWFGNWLDRSRPHARLQASVPMPIGMFVNIGTTSRVKGVEDCEKYVSGPGSRVSACPNKLEDAQQFGGIHDVVWKGSAGQNRAEQI